MGRVLSAMAGDLQVDFGAGRWRAAGVVCGDEIVGICSVIVRRVVALFCSRGGGNYAVAEGWRAFGAGGDDRQMAADNDGQRRHHADRLCR